VDLISDESWVNCGSNFGKDVGSASTCRRQETELLGIFSLADARQEELILERITNSK
jgi:hypothetical protein